MQTGNATSSHINATIRYCQPTRAENVRNSFQVSAINEWHHRHLCMITCSACAQFYPLDQQQSSNLLMYLHDIRVGESSISDDFNSMAFVRCAAKFNSMPGTLALICVRRHHSTRGKKNLLPSAVRHIYFHSSNAKFMNKLCAHGKCKSNRICSENVNLIKHESLCVCVRVCASIRAIVRACEYNYRAMGVEPCITEFSACRISFSYSSFSSFL